MIVANIMTFGRGYYIPNTFIGGVGATINTPNLLASIIQIDVDRIQGFRVIGANIECAIIGGTYVIPQISFGNTVLANANQNITYYIDENNLVTNVASNAFQNCQFLNTATFRNYGVRTPAAFAGCIRLSVANFNWNGIILGEGSVLLNCALTEFIAPNCTSTGGFAPFRGNEFTNIFAPNLVTIQTFSFAFNTELESLTLNSWTGGGQSQFQNNTKLKTVSCTSLLVVPPSAFQNCFILESITSSQFTFLGSFCFTSTRIPNFIANNVTAMGAQIFQFATMTLIELKKCKSISQSNDLAFNLSNTGFTIRINDFLRTSGASGTADINLLLAKNNRSAIVEFYDDNGVQVLPNL
jgi:hypothetical protein